MLWWHPSDRKQESNMPKFTVSADLTIRHTDIVEADTIEQARQIVDSWMADDFTEDDDCSRSWEIEVN
jgi:hypothetical protein